MKWIGQHIWDFISRFRSKVYLEDIDNAGSDTDAFLVKKSDGEIAIRTGAEVLSDIGASSESTDLEFSGDTANGVLTYGGAAQIDVESTLTYDGSSRLTHAPPAWDLTKLFYSLDLNDSAASSARNCVGIDIDYDKTVDTSGGHTITGKGINIDLNDSATGNSGSTVLYGISNTNALANANGTSSIYGIQNTLSGGDTQFGIRNICTGAATGTTTGFYQTVEDGGVDIQLNSSANTADYFNISTGAEGATTISTVDADTSAAHLTFEVDGLTKFDGLGVEIENDSATGAPALTIDNDDTDQVALYIDAENIDNHVVSISAENLTTAGGISMDFDSLTTGVPLYIDWDDALTTSINRNSGGAILIDYNKSGNVASGQTVNVKGTQINMSDDATGNVGSMRMTGLDINLDSAGTGGSNVNTGLLMHVIDGNSNIGLDLTCEDGVGSDIILRSSADSGDYCAISTLNHGATTITTVDDDATAANITLDADGEIILDAADPYIRFYNDGTEMAHISSHHSATFLQLLENGGSGADYFIIKVEAAGATTISTLDNAGTDADLTFDIDGKIEVQSSVSKFNKIYDFNATTFENLYSDDEGTGKILRYSPGADESPAGSELFFLHTDGTWNQTDADAVASGASQLLGVGLGASARTTGVLLEGFVRIASTEILNVPLAVDGLPVYVSTTVGHFDFTAPSGNNDYVRVVGYAIDSNGGDVLIYFNPSKTWIEITA